MQTGLNIKFNNKYHVELIDSTSGKLKQSGDFHNTQLIGFYGLLIGKTGYSDTEASFYAHQYDMCKYIRVGSGSTPPTFNDTKLASELWASGTGTNIKTEWVDDYTIRKTATFTFPANASHVGTVREIAMEYGYYGYYHGAERSANRLATRALLTDSEGQIITFDKTDLDILVITVTAEVSMMSNSDTFKVNRKSTFLRRLVGVDEPSWSNDWRQFASINGSLNLIRYKDSYENNTSGSLSDKAVSVGNGAVKSKLTADEAYLTYDVGRLASTDVTAQTFYTAVSLPTIGYWPLPNEESFPAYDIKGINIGTGDGSTTSFENPLNYFMKDTDKVYKNGVLLTRGVDYTINHMGNKDCKPEVTQMIKVKSIRSDVDGSLYPISVRPLIIPSSAYKSVGSYDMSTEAPVFNNSNPLYIEYEEAVTMNCLKWSGNTRAMTTGGGMSNVASGTTFYLDYSLNGDEYIEIGSAKTTAQNGGFVLDFADVTAKYWRIRTSYSSGTNVLGIYYSYDDYLTLNSKDPYIVFAEAPANGDSLTMDVKMDIIMKNDNFVVDLGCRIDFNIK